MTAPTHSGANVEGIYAVRRASIGADDIAFALGKRQGERPAGWQACAAMLDRSAHDLRAAADPGYEFFRSNPAYLVARAMLEAQAAPTPPRRAPLPQPVTIPKRRPPSVRSLQRAAAPARAKARAERVDARITDAALREALLADLAGRAHWTPSETLAQACGIRTGAVGARIRRMCEAGLVESQRVGVWRLWFLTPAGFADRGLEPREALPSSFRPPSVHRSPKSVAKRLETRKLERAAADTAADGLPADVIVAVDQRAVALSAVYQPDTATMALAALGRHTTTAAVATVMRVSIRDADGQLRALQAQGRALVEVVGGAVAWSLTGKGWRAAASELPA